MKKHAAILSIAGGLLFFPLAPFIPTARADLFGGDVAVLTQILAQSVQQLTQLKQILATGGDTLGLLRSINQGINDSLRMGETFGVRVDPGLYRQVTQVDQAVSMVERVFGRTVDSPLAPVQRNTDQAVAEAISFDSELYDYAKNLDEIGEEIKTYSHATSPGGAAKLTAQSLGVMIHVLNQQMRASGQGLKLQAQALAVQNKKEKDETAQYLKEGRALSHHMTAANVQFQFPRF